METPLLSAPRRRPISAYIIVFILGLAIGFAGGIVYERKGFYTWRAPTENNQPETTGQAPQEGKDSSPETISLPPNVLTGVQSPSVSFDNGAYAFTVENQNAGSAVTLTNVTLAERTWIAIHDERNNVPGVILGAGRFPAGINPRTNIPLAVPTEPGKTYYTMIHANSPDDVFDSGTDASRKDASGTVMMTRFSTLP